MNFIKNFAPLIRSVNQSRTVSETKKAVTKIGLGVTTLVVYDYIKKDEKQSGPVSIKIINISDSTQKIANEAVKDKDDNTNDSYNKCQAKGNSLSEFDFTKEWKNIHEFKWSMGNKGTQMEHPKGWTASNDDYPKGWMMDQGQDSKNSEWQNCRFGNEILANKNIPTEREATQGSQPGTQGLGCVTHWPLESNISRRSGPERKKTKIGVKDDTKIGDRSQEENDDSCGAQKSSPEEGYRGGRDEGYHNDGSPSVP